MHESMSCFFNDFDKKMEVPATRRLVVRKNQFLKAIALVFIYILFYNCIIK